MAANHHLTLQVREVRELTDNVRAYLLCDPDGWELPPFEPGAHIGLLLPDASLRSYSLWGDSRRSTEYRIAIRRDDNGRGGSKHWHESLRIGSVVSATLPLNFFRLVETDAPIAFIAGGIGITPLLPMIRRRLEAALPFTLHYCARSREDAPFAAELQGESWARSSLATYFADGELPRRLDAQALVASLPSGAHCYCCGPTSLMNAVRERAQDGGADLTLHFESFEEVPPPAEWSGEVCQIRLLRSDRDVVIPRDDSLARGLARHGVTVPTSCMTGSCGTCKVAYRQGSVVHRDFVLSPEQQKTWVAACVSSCASAAIELDL